VAISPFNFTAIGANLPTSPALMGNVVLWKPASTSVLSNWVVYKVLQESGLPPGVIQFIPGSGAVIGELVFNHRMFAGLHFTGSTAVFNDILFKTATNLQKGLYLSYPRIVGETGGKDFHFVHRTADVAHVVNNTIRGAFEYQGQKCSACSRAYFPDNLWPQIRASFVEELKKVHMGQPDDFSTFMSAVIDKNSFENIRKYIDEAKSDKDCEIISGGTYDASKGYFVAPTIVVVRNAQHKLLQEEIFGPVLTVYVYPADQFEETMKLCDTTSSYALTGAIFATDREAIVRGTKVLRNAAGNFYINDKCTGAVVGQQPFGGARSSGTNDKAGANLNLLRWVSARAIKENFVPLTSWQYPHMQADK
jgi:1-pyrroline-5-carboxylate dehydrogenase